MVALRRKIREERKIKLFIKYFFNNNELIKYLVVFIIAGVIAGMSMPKNIFQLIISNTRNNPDYLLGNGFPLLFIFVIIFIGIIFDNSGRKAVIATLFLLVGVINALILLIQQDKEKLNIFGLIFLILIIAISLFLITGDLGKKGFYGRILGILIIFTFLGIYFGMEMRILFFKDESNFYLPGIVISICVMIGLYLISFLKTSLTPDERDWKSKLLHLYVVHQSGLLLYDHKFKSEENLASNDLISSGLMGITALLKEITQGNQQLRIIDHGDKKLLFQWDSMHTFVVIAVIEKDLVIIRKKAEDFCQLFEAKFRNQLDNYQGGDISEWNESEILVNLVFLPKMLI
ncbi:MAG: hypothetical protein ACTSWL_04480 [Promethearchaeota archaeon]